MENTRTVLLETNTEVVLWYASRCPLISVKNKYVVHQNRLGHTGKLLTSDPDVRDVMEDHYDNMAGISVSSIYDYHHGNMWEICQLQKQ